MKKDKLKNKISRRRASRTHQTIKVKNHTRLSVFRSNKFVYAQIIDDREGKTLAAANSSKLAKENKTTAAHKTGLELAKIAKEKGVAKVAFDRGQYKYHGRVKALAEGAREGGLSF